MKYFSSAVIDMPRAAKILVVLSVDICLCVVSVYLAFYLRLGEFIAPSKSILTASFIAALFALPIFVTLGLYRSVFRFSGWSSILTITKAATIFGALYAFLFTVVSIDGVPRTIGIIQPILLLLMVAASRGLANIWLSDFHRNLLGKKIRRRTLIYGAGVAGRELARALAGSQEIELVGYLDDNEKLHGHMLDRQIVYKPSDLPRLVKKLNISDVLLAIPSVGRQRRNQILHDIKQSHVSIRSLPSVSDLAQGKVEVSNIRELDIEDLLGRDTMLPNHKLLSKNIAGKIVLVTGAGGSIGSELCRQIISIKPDKLLLVDQCEHALYNVYEDLSNKGFNGRIYPLIGSVQDRSRVNEIISLWRPDTIYHAAAFKHVPLVEHNATEGLKNNVFSTIILAQASIDNQVSNFVLVSSDKAVRPTNVMGASKRLSEMVVQALAKTCGQTKFCMVRFGNVLGSSGSVVPKFREQIKKGGPITLTHPEITRFFMTIPEAAQLVIQAGSMAKGGDVFVLDMGEPIKIIDLARRMIELSGLTVQNNENPEGDIEISITKLRPGEKLYEELLIGRDPKKTLHPKIMKAHEPALDWQELERELDHMSDLLKENRIKPVYELLKKLVTDYQPEKEIVDWVYVAKTRDADVL